MNAYPLIRNRWSNEHLLAVLFFAVSLYQLPDWVNSISSMFRYLLFAAAALLLDTAINYLRYKKPICAVSSAVTAAVLYPVIKGLPGWAGLLGIAAALIVGKHIWGGTGKNIFNPAVTAMLFLSIMFSLKIPVFEPSYLLLPALVLSLPFIAVRVFPGLGFMLGMLTMLFFRNSLDLVSFIAYGVVFWSCIVITDPATATDKPLAGLLLGFAAGLIPLYFSPSLIALSSSLLIFNGASFVLGQYSNRRRGGILSGLKIKPVIAPGKTGIEMTDLTERQLSAQCNDEDVKAEDILERIDRNGVFGMGGAGFPTINKLEAVIKSGAKEKYLIVNGMECDPGLIHDKWLMHNRQSEIAKGIEVLRKVISFNKIYCISKDIRGLHLPEPVEMHQMPERYPYGAEKIFVEKLMGINIPAGSNPAQYGVLVLNVQTVLAVYEAVCRNRKADTRYLTVADLFTGVGQVVRVGLGDRVADIVDKTVGIKGVTFIGGGIMQAHQALDEEVVGKTINFIAVGLLPKYKESVQCINCGLCRLRCPMGLNVKKIADLLDDGKMLEAQTHNTDRCISCGICSCVCPAGKNLSGRIAKK